MPVTTPAPDPAPAARLRFDGEIAGAGSRSGVRVVVGMWTRSPYGDFADAMVERADGHRILIAPSAAVADFVQATYTFDEIRIEPVELVRGPATREVRSPSLKVCLRTGRRTVVGAALRLVPGRLATSPRWCALIDPLARRLRPGVRTRGSAGHGRLEWYAARDEHRLTTLEATLDGTDLGPLRPVEPPVRFGFGSAPRRPALVRVTTLIDLP